MHAVDLGFYGTRSMAGAGVYASVIRAPQSQTDVEMYVAQNGRSMTYRIAALSGILTEGLHRSNASGRKRICVAPRRSTLEQSELRARHI